MVNPINSLTGRRITDTIPLETEGIPMAKKPTHITATVSGKGYFPLDMLRYDTCWPTGGRDVEAIADTFVNHRNVWSINVTRANTGPFSTKRWESFGVSVKPY